VLVLVPLVLAACVLGPGLLLLRFVAGRPLERLLAAIASSLLLTYLATFVIYLSGLPSLAYGLVPALGLVCARAAGSELRLLLRDPEVRAALTGYGVLALWCVTLLALVRNYGGGGWATDWLEHYQRSLFFLEHRSPEALIPPANVHLTDRPPLFNLLGTLVLACSEKSFPAFQLMASLLNTLLYLPVVAFALRFAGTARAVAASHGEQPSPVRRAQRLSALVLISMMASPFIVVNATYSWTKLLAAYFILVSLYFYVRGVDTSAFRDFLVSFGALTTGLLTHYSAGPYVAILVVHFLSCVLWKQPQPLRKLLGIIALCAPLLASWVAWAVWQFGVASTLASNSSVAEAKVLSFGANVLKVARNIVITIVPHPLRDVYPLYAQPNVLGEARDYFFLINQTNVLFMLGSTAWLCCALLLLNAWRHRSPDGTSRRSFWLGFSLAALVLGIAVVGSPDDFGLGHICLHALVPLGVAYIAQGFTRLMGWQRRLLIVGLLLDLEFVALHFYLQHLSWPLGSSGYGLSAIARGQFQEKARFGIQFLGDLLVDVDGLVVAVLCLLALGAVRWAITSLRESTQPSRQLDLRKV
jgi:hypothetical protein